MQQKSLAKHLLNIVVGVIPLVYLAVKWGDLPEATPLNYGVDGSINSTGNKAEFLMAIAFMSIISVGVYLLLINIHKIDPKRAKEGKSAMFDKIATGMVVFLSALELVIIQQALQPNINFFQIAILPILGALFMFLGNIMYSVKPNYFAGIRIPWTLNDDDNWKKTHRLAGVIWFIGGLLMILMALVLTPNSIRVVLNIVIMVMVLIPVIYSFVLFKQKQNSNN